MFYSVASHCLGLPVMELEGVCELALQDMVSSVLNKVISNSLLSQMKINLGNVLLKEMEL